MDIFARVINLDERLDRWQRLQPVLKRSRYTIERFPAVKVSKEFALSKQLSPLSLRTRANLFRERKNHEDVHGLGAVGCYLSHVEVWKQFLHSGAQLCLVLEDDIRDTSDIDLHMDWFLQRRKEWDVALLGWLSMRPLEYTSVGTVKPFPSAQGFFGAHSYMLTRAAAQFLVQSAFPVELQADLYLQAICDRFELRILATPYEPIRQLHTGSNVWTLCLLCNTKLVYTTWALAIAAIVYTVCIALDL